MSAASLLLLVLGGLTAGSLVNVLISRRDRLKTVINDFSRCPHCQRRLTPGDLIPLLSFALLTGKCRYCKAAISWQYPLVEVSGVVLFLFIGLRSSAQSIEAVVGLLALLLLATLLLAIAIIDAIEQQFPSVLVYLAIATAGLFGLINVWLVAQGGSGLLLPVDSLSLLGGALIGVGVIGWISVLTRGRGIGEGDIYLALIAGVLTGYPYVLLVLALAFIIGGAIAAALLLTRRRHLGDRLAFGPMIIIATLIVLLYGEPMLSWLLL